jgi:hypothetical protein
MPLEDDEPPHHRHVVEPRPHHAAIAPIRGNLVVLEALLLGIPELAAGSTFETDN